jgi:predicted DNA-binding protein with PD1-like motif
VHSSELTIGRTFGVTFDHGEDFFPPLSMFCKTHGIRHRYIPMFLAAFAEAAIVGACDKLEDPDAPVWSRVHLTNVEAFGCGTLAYDPERDEIVPHIHTTLGEKTRSATGHTSHLLEARVQFLVEMLVVEVIGPTMTRPVNPQLYNVPLLAFAQGAREP